MGFLVSEAVGTVKELTPWALRKRARAYIYGKGAHAAGADGLWAGIGAMMVVGAGVAMAVGALLAAGV